MNSKEKEKAIRASGLLFMQIETLTMFFENKFAPEFSEQLLTAIKKGIDGNNYYDAEKSEKFFNNYINQI